MQKIECLGYRGLHICSAVHLTSMAADRATLAVKDTACFQSASCLGEVHGPSGKDFWVLCKEDHLAVVMGLTVPEIL